MTPHNRAKVGEIARTVLMPGDPQRAKFTAENYFENPVLVTDVRGILGYTGTYKGMPISVMASGMGAPSIGIYSYELYTHYDVDAIIRIGTSGGLQDYIPVGGLVLAMTCSTDHSWASQYNLNGTLAPCVDYSLFETAVECARKDKRPIWCGMVFSSNYFSSYNALGPDEWKSFAALGALVQDMESHALYCNAMYTKKRALAILTMTDNVVTGESFRDEERMEGNRPMIELALETAYEDWRKRQ
ncbi:MAG: purine-nucleoside phosphorylase [Candidatus Ornithospirochaeta sp.]